MLRRDLLRLAGPAVLAARGRGQARLRPNVLLILADDLGFGDVSFQGVAADIRTPHIDAIAAQGIRFRNAYSNCPVCSPTRAALLSGQYPELTGVPGVVRLAPDDSWGYLSPRVTLLPQLLQQAGYRTALTGKWHLGVEPENLPNARGFQRFRGQLGGMMMDYYTHQEHQGKEPDTWRDTQRINPSGHATDLLAQWAMESIEEHAKAGQPWFHYLAFNAPHDPVQPPAEWLAKVQQRQPGISPARAKLAALIEHMDDAIGRVMDTLHRTGQRDNTLVLFTSDNGGLSRVGANNGPWRGGKEDVYEGGIRVPFAAAWPGRIQAGTVSDHVQLSMDAGVTIAEATGVRWPARVDGVSFLPTLLGQTQPPLARDLFWSRREGNPRYQAQSIYAARRGDWKLVYNSPFAPMELYHLAADPAEAQNLAAGNKELFNTLAKSLRLHVQRGGAVPWQKPAA